MRASLARRRRLLGGVALSAITTLLTTLSTDSTQLIAHPLELGSIYQDREATTLVTAPGQLIGFAEDWGVTGQKPVPGPELFTNVWFSTGEWVHQGGGTYTVTNATTATDLNGDTMIPFVAGTLYEMRFTISVSSGNIIVYPLHGSPYSFGNGTHLIRTITNASTFRFRALAGQTATVSNISIKKIPGYHAAAISDAARGYYAIAPDGGIRNLLTYTEDFSNAAWTKNNSTIVSNRIVEAAGAVTNVGILRNLNSFLPIGSFDTTLSIVASEYSGGAKRYLVFGIGSTTGTRWAYIVADLALGTITQAAGEGIQTLIANVVISPTSGGSFRVSGRFSSGLDRSSYELRAFTTDNPTPTFTTATVPSYTGDGVSGINIDDAQGEVGATLTAYQKVVSQYEVTEEGKASKPYVAYNGTNTAYATAALPAPGVDKVQIFGATQKFGTGTFGAVVDTGTNGINGFGLYMPDATNLLAYSAYVKGNNRITGNNYPTGSINTITVTHDLAEVAVATQTIMRVNGTAVALTGTVAASGLFNTSEALNYGARAGTSLFFKGNHYATLGPIVRFSAANATTAQIEAGEDFYTEALAA